MANSVNYPAVTAGVAWDFAGVFKTTVNIDNAKATNGSNHVNLLGDEPLPITLATFRAQLNPGGSGIRLEWGTVSEVNNYGFYVQRREGSAGTYAEVLNSFVAGHGTTLEPQSYSFVDNTLPKAGQYVYRLKQVDLDGTEHLTEGVSVEATLTSVVEAAPLVFQLMQNYPNPFNPSTQVKFSVETTGKAVVKVYDVRGSEVATLFDGIAEAGRYYSAKLDAGQLATGIYIYRLTTDKKSDVKKMLLLR